jgi:hypothetical protein
VIGSPYAYQEYPKWIHSPNSSVIVQDAEEERRILFENARDIGREKANSVQRLRADALAVELAPEIWRLRASGCSLRDIADALSRRGIRSARGRQWGPAQILRLLRRAQNAVAAGEIPIAPSAN